MMFLTMTLINTNYIDPQEMKCSSPGASLHISEKGSLATHELRGQVVTHAVLWKQVAAVKNPVKILRRLMHCPHNFDADGTRKVPS